jgi:DNA-binding transcriptional regulator YiaG
MKYESDILEMIHENAIANFKIGILSEEDMRKYDKLCLPEEALQDNTAHGDNSHETVNIEHPELVTV